MSDLEQVQHVLNEALAKEKLAEINCLTIMNELEINGYKDQIEKIKSDEIKHQNIIRELINQINT